MACRKPPAISTSVHRAWTCEELKATIMEHRMTDPAHQQATVMNSVTNLTLAELKSKADELGVLYPAKVTKGNLLRLIRDSTATPGTELMKIGKYKGYEFQEIPRQYGMWAAREIRMSTNPHVELIRFAKWWEAKEYEHHHYGDQDSIEANATVPYPEESSSRGAASTAEWDVVSGQHPWSRDLPIDPRKTKRGMPTGGYQDMDAEVDPNTMEEIRALETRLAVLKQKAKAGATPPTGDK